MKLIRELIRSILSDDALYRRRDLPGDLDDPPEIYDTPHDDEDESDCGCGCGNCDDTHDDEDDYVTPKYALYSAIGDAISVYDDMEDESFGDDEADAAIMRVAEEIKRIKR
jgi:hypothetical protein